jgi:hypothetical protein
VGVVLPGWADELLDLIDVSWPNVDEDDYREMANTMREFADDIDEARAIALACPSSKRIRRARPPDTSAIPSGRWDWR